MCLKWKYILNGEWNLPLCCRTLGWKPRLLRGFPSFFDIYRSFGAVVPDVIVVVAASLVIIVVADIVAVVGRHVGAIAGERHRWWCVIDVRRPRMDRKRRRLRSRGAADDRASGTDASLGPRWRRVIVRLCGIRDDYCNYTLRRHLTGRNKVRRYRLVAS